MHCLFAVPHLFWPDREAYADHADLRAPALELIFGRGRKRILPTAGFEAWLAGAFGFAEEEPLPVAPFRLVGDGGAPGDANWLCADPVHLRVDRDRLVLADGDPIAPDAIEAAALVATLNTHFATDGLEFSAPEPARWYVRTAALPTTGAPSLRAARGRTIDSLFGDAKTDARWRALGNEIQMLFHEHPVNIAREALGKPAINGVWLWGGGRWRSLPAIPSQRWLTDDPLAAGVARAAGLSVGPVPQEFALSSASGFEATWTAGSSPVLDGTAEPRAGKEPSQGFMRIVLGDLEHCVTRGDMAGWREAVTGLEQRWFAPALEALRARRIGMISIHAIGDEATLQVETTAGDLRHFWRRTRPLATYVHH